MLVLATAAVAQQADDPAADAALHDPSVDSVAAELDQRPDTSGPIAPLAKPTALPVVPHVPVAVGSADEPLPENAFLAGVRGVLTRAKDGGSVFVFDPDAEGRSLAPMPLLPCPTLERMERLAVGPGHPSVFVVTGRVLLYRKHNYLLPAAITHALVDDAGRVEQPVDEPAEVTTSVDPSIRELLGNLEARRREGGTAEPPGTRRLVLPKLEGARSGPRFLVNRRGRLVRDADGRLAVRFDNDPDTASAIDPPMVLMPCERLVSLERRLLKHPLGEAEIELSGLVYEYRGRPYVLPTLVREPRPSTLAPLR